MKPISVRFQCFGPYVQEQFVDFRELEKSGLFLICGETGSGKTTILDAICYALYGKSSGGNRGKLAEMRCKQADPSAETFVEYIFSSGENTYRFYRGLKPRKQRKESAEAGKPQTFNEEYECQILKDGCFVPMSDTKAIQGYMDGKAEEILGLKYEQFKQVVILPQGQFEKLLTSNSDEKEAILVTLFHAEKWKKIADLMCEEALGKKRELDLKSVKLNEKIEHFHCETLEQLEELTNRSKEEAEKLLQQGRDLEKEVQKCKKAEEQTREEDKAFRELDTAEKKLQQLLERETIQIARREKLKRAEAAETIMPVYTAYRQAEQTVQKAEKEKKKQENDLASANKNLENLRKEQEKHEQKRADYEQQRKQKIQLESLAELYQSLNGKEKARNNAQHDLEAAERELQKAEDILNEATSAVEKAAQKQQKVDESFRKGQKVYLQNIGSVLAEKLVEGEKCPVCGSCHHPEPAQATEDHVSEKELEILTKANEKALADLRKATSAREKAVSDQQGAALRKETCRQKADTAAQLYEQALAQRMDGVSNEAQRIQAIEQMEREISSFEETEHSMQDRINQADGELQSAAKLAQEALRVTKEAEEACAEAKNAWDSALAGVSFGSTQEYIDACMEAADRQKLQAECIQYDTDLGNARTDAAEKKESLKGRIRPDVKAAKEKLHTAEKEKRDADDKYILKNKEWEDEREAMQQLQKELPILEQKKLRNQENVEFAKKLRGDSGISLQRYVLGVMLTSITREANRLLKTVYGGRYQLYRTNEASGKAHKRGLELEVADRDGRRTVNSLSGGEKFLLSLSLGIGLASVVQAQGNGIRLEAMFIDEGFGSLDTKCIDDAMEILESVRKSSGIVGIISHVERLAETIPAKIEITKSSNGSKCRVIC